jgi:hypothetical protein
MSCAAEKAAFLRSLIYRQRPTHYSGGGSSHYSAPTALRQAYQDAQRDLRPKSFGGGRSNFQIKLAHGYQPSASRQPSAKVIQSYGESSGWSIATEPSVQTQNEDIARVSYAPMTYDGSITKKQQDLEQKIQEEKTDGATTHKYGASMY